jgi:amidase/aspartyl-tRNA(Asn)/glutamyl-tRNA(Gln) amidotransferase subunit A
MFDYYEFHKVRTAILDAHQDIFDKFDVILAPVSGCLPVLNTSDNDTKGPEMIGGEPVDPLIGFAYTYLENMIGTPAASIPVGFSKENHLPIGMQIIGKRYFDEDIFTVAYALEDMNPWNYDIAFCGKGIK